MNLAWPHKPLASIGKVVRGVSFDKNDVRDEAGDGYLPILRAGNIHGNLIIDDDLVWVPKQRVTEDQLLQVGDVAIAMSSGSSSVVGKVAQLNVPWKGAVGAFCAAIRFGPSIIPRFGAYWLQGPSFQAWRLSQCQGANIQNLRKTDLEAIQFPVPPRRHQKRIVEILDAAEELRCLREQGDLRTADLIPALFHEMFGDPAANPKGWNIHLLGNLVAEFRYGTSTKSGPQGYPTLRIPNVVGEKIDLADLKLVPVSDTEFSKWRLQEGDVLFVRTNGNPYFVGRTAVFTSNAVEGSKFPSDQFIFASYLIRARVNPGLLNPFFLQQFLRTGEGRRILRKSSKTSAGQYNINTEGLGTIPVPLPPLLLQRDFAERVAGIRAMEASQAASRCRLDDLFQSLLYRAFRGDL